MQTLSALGQMMAADAMAQCQEARKDMKFAGDKTDVTALVAYAQSLEAECTASMETIAMEREKAERAEAEVARLRASLTQVEGFAHVMNERNWRDLRLHISRQCDILNGGHEQSTPLTEG